MARKSTLRAGDDVKAAGSRDDTGKSIVNLQILINEQM